MVRTPCCEKMGMKKGAWTPEEDNKLTAYIKRYGIWNWRELPKYAGLSRCGKSCRLRWMNYLRPNIKHGKYSREEEEIIIKLHESIGNRWSAIAAKLPGRTDNEIKNHWHTNLKKRLKQNPTESGSKLHSDEIFECDADGKIEGKPSTSLPNAPTQHIVETSPLSKFSSLKPDSAVVIGTNYIGNEKMVSSETFVEFEGNFWTEPYSAGNSYIQEDFPTTLDDPGLVFPFSQVSLGEASRPYGSYDDDEMDWFNLLLQGGLPDI